MYFFRIQLYNNVLIDGKNKNSNNHNNNSNGNHTNTNHINKKKTKNNNKTGNNSNNNNNNNNKSTSTANNTNNNNNNSSNSNNNSKGGASSENDMFNKHHALPYRIMNGKQHDRDFLISSSDRSKAKPFIDHISSSFCSSIFRVQYQEQKIRLNEGCLFRLNLPYAPKQKVYIDIELAFTELHATEFCYYIFFHFSLVYAIQKQYKHTTIAKNKKLFNPCTYHIIPLISVSICLWLPCL